MRNISISITAAVSLLAGAYGASAADLGRPIPYMPPPAPIFIYNWTGFYVGGNLGAGWASGTMTDSFTGASLSDSKSGFIGGGQVGYNYQVSNFVFGAEWDFDATALNASRTGGFVTASANTNWVTTLAARFGVASGNWLFYGKAGGGWVNNSATVTNNLTGAAVSASNTNSGWLVGAGIEYGFTPNWSAKIEYDYLGLNTWNVNSTVFAPAADNVSVSRNIQMLKVGLNYRF
jgi:outer membrane immunogenic protein